MNKYQKYEDPSSYVAMSDYKEMTVIIIEDGKQMTLDGSINPVDVVGIELEKGVDEVVDDVLVHTYYVV